MRSTAVRVVAVVLVVAVLATTGWGLYLAHLASGSLNRSDVIAGSGDAGPRDMNLLLVGNDSRSSLTAEQEQDLHTGGDAGRNTDTMILVHLPADGSQAAFVSFPRDSYVEIPGHGRDKLNSAYAYGYQSVPRSASESDREVAGGKLLIRTISDLTGLSIDHYAEVDLLGFFNLSSVVGGVQVNLCKPVDDRRYSGAVFPAGVQTISGADALKFVRQRHGLPRGDFDRIVRQQVFIGGVLSNMLSEQVLLNPIKQRRLVQAAAGALTVDKNLDLIQLAKQMQSVDRGKIEFQTIPYLGDGKDAAGRYILNLADPDTLHAFFANLSGEPQPSATPPPKPSATPPPKVSPADVAVEVYNGTGTAGLAAAAQAALGTAGFAVGATGNADTADHARTEIRYAPNDKARATTLAGQVKGAVLSAQPDLSEGTVQLLLGSDFRQVGEPVAASAKSPGAATPSAASVTAVGKSGAAPAADGPSAAEGKKPRTAADSSCIN